MVLRKGLFVSCLVTFPVVVAAMDIRSVTVYTGTTPAGPWTLLTPTAPTTTIFVDQYVRLDIGLVNDSGRLGKMCVIDTSDPYGPTIQNTPTCVSYGVDPNLSVNWCNQNADAAIWPGQYWVWPRLSEGCGTLCSLNNCVFYMGDFSSYLYPVNMLAPVSFVSAEPITTWDFNGYSMLPGAPGQTEGVNWVFRAEREFQGMDFLVFAYHHDDYGDMSVGCAGFGGNPCPFGGGDCLCDEWPNCGAGKNYEGSLLRCSIDCMVDTNPFPSLGAASLDEILVDYWGAKINIVSPLTVETGLRAVSAGVRPPNTAYLGDVIELAATTFNGAAFSVSVTGRASRRFSLGSSLYLESKAQTAGPCGAPAIDHYWPSGTVFLGPGLSQMFTWSFTVTGNNTCPILPEGGGLFFRPVDMAGAISESTTLFVIPPPLTVSVSTWLDPDGPAEPEPAYPLPLIGPSLAGTLYYMSEDTLEVRVTYVNTSNSYSYDIAPNATLAGGAGGSYQLVSGPPPFPIMLDAAPAPTSSTVLVYSYAINPAGALAKSCIPTPGTLDFSVAARGVCGNMSVKAADHPFRGPSNLFYDIVGLSAISIEKDKEFSVNLTLRNTLARRIKMSSRVNNPTNTEGLVISKPLGDSTDWVRTNLPIPFQQTWNPNESKIFQWKVKGTQTGTMYIASGVSYGASGLCPWNEGLCLTACCSGAGCPWVQSSKIEVLRPQHLEIVSFTVTPTYVFDEGNKCHVVRTTMVIANKSETETIFIDSIKAPCNAATGSGLTINWGPNPAPPLEVPPQAPAPAPKFTFPVDFELCVKCGVDREFGFFGSGACAPQLRGWILGCATETQVANAITNMITLDDPPRLDCQLALDATGYSEGETITLYYSVTNTAQNDALSFTVTVTANHLLSGALTPLTSGLTEATSGVGPPALLAGSGVCGATWLLGASKDVYVATFLAERAGKVRFSAYADSTDLMYGARPTCARSTMDLIIQEASSISVTAWATAVVNMPQDCVGCPVISGCQPDGTNCIRVGVSVQNRGDITLSGLTPSVFMALVPCGAGNCLLSQSYTGSVVQISQPPPGDIGQDLGGHDSSRSFTWTYSPSGVGCMRFRLSVSGSDYETGEPRYEELLTNCVQILPQPPVYMRLLSAPKKVLLKQEFEVEVEVYNPGKTAVRIEGGEPSLSFLVLGTGEVVTDDFEVITPPSSTVEPGTSRVLTVRVRPLPTAPLGVVRLRLPQGAAFIAEDTVTGLPWAVLDSGASDPPTLVEVVDDVYALEGADPNPFRPNRDGVTWIKFRLPETGQVRLKVYSIAGELVCSIIDEARGIGYYEEPWDGRNADGQVCASGIYIIRIEGPNKSEVVKLAIIK